MTDGAPSPSIAGRVALVTGAGRGIGRVYAQALAGAGVAVVVADVLEEGIGVAEEIRGSGGRASFIATDVTDAGSAAAAVAHALSEFGGLDILVNNAAIYGGLRFLPADQLDEDRWDRVLRVNTTGVWLMARAACEPLAVSGHGVILNQSSTASFVGNANFADYVASKGAVNALTRALARDFGPRGIRVNGIAPGGIGTEATIDYYAGDAEAFSNSVKTRQIIGRPGQPADLVGPLLFLVSDASAFVTGQTLIVDGGGFLLG